MLSKKDKQKLLSKFKLIEVLNGLNGTHWWRGTVMTCQRCQFNFHLDKKKGTAECQNLRKRLCYSFQINDIFESEHDLGAGYRACVEFLRSPIPVKTLDK